MRQPVHAEQIDAFLKALGKEVRVPCRIYLVGGTSLVTMGLRDQTIDIDLSFEIEDAHHQKLIEAIRHLKEELHLNIEEASPKDFIPLPPGWKERCLSIGTFGKVTAFHFDFYSTALSKIDRGGDVDLEDVQALLQSNKIEWKKLKEFYQVILSEYGTQSLRQDPARIRRNFKILEEMLGV